EAIVSGLVRVVLIAKGALLGLGEDLLGIEGRRGVLSADGAADSESPLSVARDLSSFAEIHKQLLEGPKWKVAHSSLVSKTENISESEVGALERAPSEFNPSDAPSRSGFFTGPEWQNGGSTLGAVASVIETAALTDANAMHCAARAQRLVIWCLRMGLRGSSAQEVDVILTAFLARLALDGFDAGAGRATPAAARHLLPALGATRIAPPRACKSTGGWKKLTPPCMRLPIPRPAALAIVGVLLARRQIPFAIFVVLSFAGYLRPSEAFHLRGRSLAPPNPLAGEKYAERGLVLNPGEEGRPGKTGITDESVAPVRAAWWPLWAALKAARPGASPLWHFQVTEARGAFDSAAEALATQPSLRALRRSAASDDLLGARRTLAEVKDRGRWITDCSLRRYAKRIRLQQQMNMPRKAVLSFGLRDDRHLVLLFEAVSRDGAFSLQVPRHPPSTLRGRARPALAG
ncbi:unnamed protein product, partial [Prorocentrum cordatum]